MKKATIIILIFLSFWSCDSGIFSGKLKEGVINYKIEYLDDENEKPIISMLPTEMTIKFKKGYSIQEVEGWMGIFRMAGIRHIKDDTKTALLKILADKYLYSIKGGQDAFGFDPMKDKKIVYSKETKLIAGYKCKKANVTIKNKKGDEQKMLVYYTEELKAPYPDEDFDIGGIVLQTEILLGDEDDDEALTQITTAIEVKKGKVKKKEYAIPAGATKIEKEKFMQMLGGSAE